MNSSTPPSLTPAQLDAMQSRFALRVCARLDEATAQLPHDISERLRVAREQAVAAAVAGRLQSLAPAKVSVAPSAVVWSSGQVALAGAGAGGPQHHGRQPREDATGWFWRLASALPVLALVAGLWGIQQWYQREQILAAADVDMALLADELPPTAYADPGFEEFLQTSTAPVSEPTSAGPAALRRTDLHSTAL